jgi:hypothetical protein
MYCLISVALSQPLRTAAEKEVWIFNAELRLRIFKLLTGSGAGDVEAQNPTLTPHAVGMTIISIYSSIYWSVFSY